MDSTSDRMVKPVDFLHKSEMPTALFISLCAWRDQIFFEFKAATSLLLQVWLNRQYDRGLI